MGLKDELEKKFVKRLRIRTKIDVPLSACDSCKPFELAAMASEKSDPNFKMKHRMYCDRGVPSCRVCINVGGGQVCTYGGSLRSVPLVKRFRSTTKEFHTWNLNPVFAGRACTRCVRSGKAQWCGQQIPTCNKCTELIAELESGSRGKAKSKDYCDFDQAVEECNYNPNDCDACIRKAAGTTGTGSSCDWKNPTCTPCATGPGSENEICYYKPAEQSPTTEQSALAARGGDSNVIYISDDEEGAVMISDTDEDEVDQNKLRQAEDPEAGVAESARRLGSDMPTAVERASFDRYLASRAAVASRRFQAKGQLWGVVSTFPEVANLQDVSMVIRGMGTLIGGPEFGNQGSERLSAEISTLGFARIRFLNEWSESRKQWFEERFQELVDEAGRTESKLDSEAVLQGILNGDIEDDPLNRFFGFLNPRWVEVAPTKVLLEVLKKRLGEEIVQSLIGGCDDEFNYGNRFWKEARRYSFCLLFDLFREVERVHKLKSPIMDPELREKTEAAINTKLFDCLTRLKAASTNPSVLSFFHSGNIELVKLRLCRDRFLADITHNASDTTVTDSTASASGQGPDLSTISSAIPVGVFRNAIHTRIQEMAQILKLETLLLMSSPDKIGNLPEPFSQYKDSEVTSALQGSNSKQELWNYLSDRVGKIVASDRVGKIVAAMGSHDSGRREATGYTSSESSESSHQSLKDFLVASKQKVSRSREPTPEDAIMEDAMESEETLFRTHFDELMEMDSEELTVWNIPTSNAQPAEDSVASPVPSNTGSAYLESRASLLSELELPDAIMIPWNP